MYLFARGCHPCYFDFSQYQGINIVRALITSIILILSISTLTTQANAEEVKRYVWLTQGKLSGEQIVTTNGNDATIQFSYNDRGRGPDTLTNLTRNSKGAITSLKVTGVNYTKSKVDEWFRISEDNRAVWHSAKEDGDEQHTAGRHYLSVDGAPQLMGYLAEAALMSTDNSVDLYPNGRIKLQKVNELVVEGPKGASTITLYNMHGLDIAPESVWLDAENHFFGVDMDWVAIVPEGYEAAIPAMQKVQNIAKKAYLDELGSKHIDHAANPIHVLGAKIFNPETGILSAPSDVTIKNGIIIKVEPAQQATLTDAYIIDGKDQILMPSLTEMHGHWGDSQFLHLVSAGVTNMRDMGNSFGTLKRLQKQLKSGELIGPDIYPMGFIDGKSKYSAPVGRLPEKIEEAKAMVDDYAGEGFTGIKLYSSLPIEWSSVLADYAATKGMGTKGHIPSGMNAVDAIDAGFTEITHINMIMLNFLGARELDTRTPVRFIVPGKLGHTIDPDGEEYGAFLDMMKAKGISHDPTLSIFLDMFYAQPGTIIHSARAFADHMPANAKRWLIQTPDFNEGFEADFKKSGKTAERMLKRMFDKGINIFPGTDNQYPGFTLISEMLNYERIGIPAPAIIKMATINAAKNLGIDKEVGTVAVGKKAHLILVKGNPTKNIADLYRVTRAIKGNLVIKTQELRAGMGITPWN
jgi:hypothetical protein